MGFLLASCGTTISAQQRYDGGHVWDIAQDTERDREGLETFGTSNFVSRWNKTFAGASWA